MSIITQVKGRLATITIDREHRRNALDNDALEKLISALEHFERASISIAVVNGTGGAAFCAGSDLKALAKYSRREALYHSQLFQKCTELLDEAPFATIAAVEGFCLGGGLEITLACDYRIASATAMFGFPEITFNAVASGGATIRAPRAIGLHRAREMLVFGQRIDARKALGWGLVSEVVEPLATLDAAMRMAEPYAESVDPFIISTLKRILVSGFGTSTRAGATMAYLADCAVSESDAFRSGLSSVAFKSKVKE